jgi:hypothetical protein
MEGALDMFVARFSVLILPGGLSLRRDTGSGV